VNLREFSCNWDSGMLESGARLAGTSYLLSARGARRRVKQAAGIQGNPWVYYRLPMS
jgi:hypothetical protein